MGGLRVVGLPMALGKDLAVAQQHKAVHLNAIAVELIQQVQHGLGGTPTLSGETRGNSMRQHPSKTVFIARAEKLRCLFKQRGLRRHPAKKPCEKSVAQIKRECNADILAMTG